MSQSYDPFSSLDDDDTMTPPPPPARNKINNKFTHDNGVQALSGSKTTTTATTLPPPPPRKRVNTSSNNTTSRTHHSSNISPPPPPSKRKSNDYSHTYKNKSSSNDYRNDSSYSRKSSSKERRRSRNNSRSRSPYRYHSKRSLSPKQKYSSPSSYSHHSSHSSRSHSHSRSKSRSPPSYGDKGNYNDKKNSKAKAPLPPQHFQFAKNRYSNDNTHREKYRYKDKSFSNDRYDNKFSRSSYDKYSDGNNSSYKDKYDKYNSNNYKDNRYSNNDYSNDNIGNNINSLKNSFDNNTAVIPSSTTTTTPISSATNNAIPFQATNATMNQLNNNNNINNMNNNLNNTHYQVTPQLAQPYSQQAQPQLQASQQANTKTYTDTTYPLQQQIPNQPIKQYILPFKQYNNNNTTNNSNVPLQVNYANNLPLAQQPQTQQIQHQSQVHPHIQNVPSPQPVINEEYIETIRSKGILVRKLLHQSLGTVLPTVLTCFDKSFVPRWPSYRQSFVFIRRTGVNDKEGVIILSEGMSHSYTCPEVLKGKPTNGLGIELYIETQDKEVVEQKTVKELQSTWPFHLLFEASQQLVLRGPHFFSQNKDANGLMSMELMLPNVDIPANFRNDKKTVSILLGVEAKGIAKNVELPGAGSIRMVPITLLTANEQKSISISRETGRLKCASSFSANGTYHLSSAQRT